MSKEIEKKSAMVLLAVMVGFIIAAIVQYCSYAATVKRCSERTDGTITSVSSKISNIHSSKSGRRTKTNVRYTYTYNAAFKVGSTAYAAQGKAKSEVYKKDDTAAVYYDPDDPDKCYIEKCPPDKGVKCLIFAGISLALAAGAYIRSRKE